MDKSCFEILMEFTCVQLGYCGSRINGKSHHVTDYIPKYGYVTADEFADWVFVAEGIDPKSDRVIDHKKRIVMKFKECMGTDTIYSTELNWN